MTGVGACKVDKLKITTTTTHSCEQHVSAVVRVARRWPAEAHIILTFLIQCFPFFNAYRRQLRGYRLSGVSICLNYLVRISQPSRWQGRAGRGIRCVALRRHENQHQRASATSNLDCAHDDSAAFSSHFTIVCTHHTQTDCIRKK